MNTHFILLALLALLSIVPLHAAAETKAKAIQPVKSADSAKTTQTGSAPKALLVVEGYLLQRADVIRMSIFQEADMMTEAMIGKSGMVSFPLIGSVQVKGLTIKEVEKNVKALYEKDYFKNPSIRVIVTSYAQKWVTVSGAVESPGRVPYPEEGNMNLPSAIAMTGGVIENGNTDKITLARKKGGSSTYRLAACSKIMVNPGDTVVVPRLPRQDLKRLPTCTVSGEVRNPGNVEVVDGKIPILSAIAMAGGYSRIANDKDAILQKKVGGGHRASIVNLRNIRDGKAQMLFMFPGDILIIKESRF